MGHHYLPQRLLRGFAHDEKYIWMLDMRSFDQPRSLPIVRVAHEPGMYTEELEGKLNDEIEQPFNAVLDRLECGKDLIAQDTDVLSRYVLTMYRRVPKGRDRSREALPGVSQQVERANLAQLDEMERQGEDPDLVQRARQNVSQIHARLREDPTRLWHDTLQPEIFPRVFGALRQMSWTLWKAAPGRQLLIGDNPVLFDEARGIGHARGEVLFPIRSDALLVASWQVSGQRQLTVQQTRLVNARSVAGAQRWVFFERHESWIVPFARKTVEQGQPVST